MSATPPPAPRSWRRTLVLLGLALLAAATLRFGWLPAPLVERGYARGLFPPLRDALLFVARLVPFSLAEAALLLLVAWLALRGGRALVGGLRAPRTLVALGLGGVRRLLVLASLGYLVFLATWGLNHARLPYATSAGLDVRPAEARELEEAAEALLAHARDLRATLDEDEAGVFRSRLAHDALAAAVARAYARAAQETPLLAGPAPLLRFPLVSPLLTACGISGIWSPFTAEAHVNAEQPEVQLGFSACHEAAHGRGFAREDEANFLAWRVGARADEPELAYSAELLALRHVLAVLAGVDPARAQAVQARLVDGLRRDWEAIDRFWRPRSTLQRSVRHVSETVNDSYLRSQGQALGTQSYGRMVDLLLATRRAQAGR